jgi:hypothetical protein
MPPDTLAQSTIDVRRAEASQLKVMVRPAGSLIVLILAVPAV